MSQVLVVTRHLPNNRPVPFYICRIHDNIESVKLIAENYVKEFKEEFVEFKDAEFYYDILDL